MISFIPSQVTNRRPEGKQLESTRTTNKSRNESKSNERKVKTRINSFRIEPCLNKNLKCKHLIGDKSSDDDDNDDEDYTSDQDCSLLEEREYDESDEDYEKNSIRLVDPNSKKILQGEDVNKFYYSIAKWFNNLKDSFNTSTPNRPEIFKNRFNCQKNDKLKFSLPSQKRSKLNYTKKSFTDLVTCDLKRDIKLKLKFDKSSNTDWDESEMRRYLKYRYFMSKRNKFNDSLTIVPGIGSVYKARMYQIIPNFGTLLELYISVNESTFKALLFAYANINSRYLNLINASCKNYLKKYGFDFRDATVFIPKNSRWTEKYTRQINNPKC